MGTAMEAMQTLVRQPEFTLVMCWISNGWTDNHEFIFRQDSMAEYIFTMALLKNMIVAFCFGFAMHGVSELYFTTQCSILPQTYQGLQCKTLYT
jgi:hypothetical protein